MALRLEKDISVGIPTYDAAKLSPDETAELITSLDNRYIFDGFLNIAERILLICTKIKQARYYQR